MGDDKQEVEQQIVERNRFSAVNLRVFALVAGIALFLVIASIAAIIYARGGRATPEGIVSTGNIRINSEVNDIEVTVNGEEKTPRGDLVTNLEPGEYEVQVTSPGYYNWSKTVEVRANIVKNVFVNLIPLDRQPELLRSNKIQSIVYSRDGQYAYYVISDAPRGEDVGIWRTRISESNRFALFEDNRDQKLANLEADIAPAVEAGDYQLFPSPDNNSVILRLATESPQTFVLAANELNEISDLDPIETDISFPFSRARWGTSSEQILIDNGQLLAEYSLTDSETTVIDYSASAELIYTVAGSNIYFYDTDTSLVKVYSEKTSEVLTLENKEIVGKISDLYGSRGSSNIIYYRNNAEETYFLDVDSSFQAEIESDATIISISPDSTGALMKDEDNNYFSYSVEFVPAVEEYSSQFKQITLNTDTDTANEEDINEIANMRYGSNSRRILLLDNNGTLYIADRDGSNVTAVINANEEEQVVSGSYYINGDGTDVVALIREDGEQKLYDLSLTVD